MISKARLVRSLWELGRKTWSVPAKHAAIIHTDDPIEEETLPRYCPQRYYPVHIGDTFNHRYLIIAKLGYGASSTVWLARDTHK